MPPARKRWYALGSDQDRKKARKGVHLEEVAITSNTLERYYQGLKRVRHVLARAVASDTLDEDISDWIQQQFHLQSPTLSPAFVNSWESPGNFSQYGVVMKFPKEHRHLLMLWYRLWLDVLFIAGGSLWELYSCWDLLVCCGLVNY